MALTLHYHPYTRAAGTIWALEELGQPYELAYEDLMSGAHKRPDFLALNPMGKLPTLIDSGPDGTESTVVTEAGAIALYLGDRYACGTLAPLPGSPERAPYLRWSLFAPSVIEPGLMAKAADWAFKPGQAGWGEHGAMLAAMEHAIGEGPFLLGDAFSMADVVFGGTVRWMLGFGMLEKRPSFVDYVDRLNARPAAIRAKAVNDRWIEEKGLKRS